MTYNDWQEQTLREIQRELLHENEVARRVHGVRFLSRSGGRGRGIPPRMVTLVHYGHRWRLWSGEDRQDGGRIPWDCWATEMGLADAEMARQEFERLLVASGGRF